MKRVILTVIVLLVLAGCATQASSTGAAMMSTAGSVSAEYAEPQSKYGWGVHGHWCGIGNFGGPVVDDLDAVCQAHDLCVAKKGVLNCGCDLQMMQDIGTKSWPTALYPRAYQLFEAIAVKPCQGDGTWQKKINLSESMRRAKVEQGREEPGDGFRRFLDLMGVMLSSNKPS